MQENINIAISRDKKENSETVIWSKKKVVNFVNIKYFVMN